MLGLLEPEELDEWMAAEELDPGLLGRERLTRTVALTGSALCAAWGADVDPEKLMPQYETIRRRADGARSDAVYASPNQAAALFRLHYG